MRGGGAKFYVPKKRFMGDNGSMIGKGLVMLKAGVTPPLAESRAQPGYRKDEVEVRWK